MTKMPQISQCDVEECAYNKSSKCHALAVTIGDGGHPRCDTFTSGGQHGGDPSASGQVGACKVSTCKFNKSLECSAASIRVGHHKQSCADCQTFQTA